ncbi:MAG TPA: TetR/AcrR family transcriptional regulator [Streptosporangiaceae bacterium]|nr:TetR/AcrR family transcriptional regulator [Streptosporangiaceae bacterium]
MGSETRERIVGASAELFRRQGYVATGMKEIVANARAPFGSVYHFFPGGKEQLGAETVRRSGAEYGRLLPLVLDAHPDLVEAVRAFFALAAQDLVEANYEDACPIATVALETSSTSEILRQACADVFEDWIELGSERVAAAGIPRDAARNLTIAMIAMLEGAFVLCRATRTTEALIVSGQWCAKMAEAAMPASRRTGN